MLREVKMLFEILSGDDRVRSKLVTTGLEYLKPMTFMLRCPN